MGSIASNQLISWSIKEARVRVSEWVGLCSSKTSVMDTEMYIVNNFDVAQSSHPLILL